MNEEIKSFKDLRLKKLKIRMDLRMLDSILAFIYKDSVLRTRKTLQNIYKLFEIVDDEVYVGNPKSEDRIWVIRKSLEAKLNEDFENDERIKQYCLDQVDCDSYKAEIIEGIENLKISHEESRYLIKQIEDRLQFGYAITIKEIMQRLFDKVDMDDFKTYKSIADELYDVAVAIINNKRNVSSLESDTTFSLQDEYFETVITDAVNKLKDKDKIFITVIKRWNTIFDP